MDPSFSTDASSSSSEAGGPATSAAVADLADLCERHPIARKIVFVPYAQLGQSLANAVARRVGAVGGLECRTPRSYAARLTDAAGTFDGASAVRGEKRELLLQTLLRDDDSAGPPRGVRPSQLAPSLADAIEALRMGGVSPDGVSEETPSGQGFRPLLADAYRRYTDALEAHALYDEADVFEAALQIVEGREGRPETVVALFGETELPRQALDLIEALRDQAGAFYVVGARPSPDAPATTASRRFGKTQAEKRQKEKTQQEAGAEAVGPAALPAGERRFRRAAGPLREVRSVLRDVLGKERRLDEVEVAYTTSRPYLTLLADEAERLGLPFTLGTGLPLATTRPGHAITGFYEWIESGYDAPVLIRLLRAGLLRPGREATEEEGAGSLSSHRAASVLAGYRYGPEADTYAKTLGAAIDQAEGPEEREAERLRALRQTRDFVEGLLDLVPDSGGVREMAAAGLSLLDRFGPDIQTEPADAMVSEELATTEAVADSVLRTQILDDVRSMAFGTSAPASEAAGFLRKMVEGRYVGAQNATGGALHVVPLASAGFAGRRHLYAVGMDSESAAASPAEGAFLSAEDRAALDQQTSGALPRPAGTAEESAWRFETALRRHRGPKTLVASTFDPNEGEPRHPSTLYLQAHREADGPEARTEGMVPAGDGVLLDADEAWLVQGRGVSSGEEGGGAAGKERGGPARDVLRERFPWTRHGEAARLARAKEEYTTYDGLLETDTPELDFLDPDYDGPPVSAGRLEMLAEAPYAYFVRYVLGAEPREEPALDDEPWLSARRKGRLLHDAFQAFMQAQGDRPLAPSDRDDLLATIRETAREEAERVHPGSEAVLEAALRELEECGRLFFASELQRAETATPLLHEWGFGVADGRRRDGDAGPFSLALDALDGEEKALPVRGRIDRVDRRPDGTLAVWDYKTGSQSSFSRAAPLKNGAKIQWALYALVLEQHREEPVSRSGYFFTSEKEMGTRLGFPLDEAARRETARTIDRLSDLARSGSFPIAPKAHENRPWRFGTFGRLHLDLKERLSAMSKSTSFAEGLTGKVKPHFLQE
jgi:RecB family exonuclease